MSGAAGEEPIADEVLVGHSDRIAIITVEAFPPPCSAPPTC
jgi:hypothetical protein